MSSALKRIMDIGVAAAGLILLLPLFGLLACLIRLSMGKPILYRHARPGFREKIFTLYKFRTMTEERDAEGRLLPDQERLTKIGNIIRSLSLDELPQLWNVLKGDLSLVGPRPLLIEYLPRYTPEQRRRHEAKPGITGWAQVNGRNAIGWEEKFALDVWYVDHWSLGLDLKILALTAWKVVKREGISEQGQATMRPFMGNKGEEV
jgi:lipopolysaccharide/colanic/teichoic acid biosynthesis glycosyltransferase